MKNKHIIAVTILCLPLAFAAHGGMITILDWQFETSDNPAAPSAGITSNPSHGVATFSISPALPPATEYFGFKAPGYGDQQGVWKASTGGQITLDLQSRAVNPAASLPYTVQIVRFISQLNFPFTSDLNFSLGAPLTRTTSDPIQTVENVGSWVTDTYTWNVTPGTSPLSFTIAANPSNRGMLFDRITWTIDGDLVAVPEPVNLALAGILGVGFGSWGFRRIRSLTRGRKSCESCFQRI
jgi:hypothetical protein